MTPIGKLRWTWHRLRAMDGSEIAYRVREHALRHAARTRIDPASFDLAEGSLPSLRCAQQEAPDPSALQTRWRSVADAAIIGKYEVLGQTWPGLTGPEKWHHDPETGGAWPSIPYCFDISLRFNQDRGDIKYAFELNRLQYLQPIAALAAARNDAVLATFCADELESWIDANPPFAGINWSSGIELALRIVSILTVINFIGESAFSELQKRKLRTTLNAHGYWLDRYPSYHSSANNHLIAEAAGLFLLGTLAPDLPGAARYERYGRRTLVDEIQKQILEDGVGVEQSPTYTSFVIEWLLLCVLVARDIGCPLPEAVERRLALAGEHLLWITDREGRQPRIGDDDEGRVFYSQIEPETAYVSSVLGCLSAQLGRPDLAPPRYEPHLRNVLFGFPEPPREAPVGIRSFQAGGYTAVREKISSSDVLLVFDHGPLGYLSIAAHGHADALALTLHVDGQPILIDAGTYRYLSGGRWREYFRGTRAHNTLNIAGQDQSIIAGPFNWSHKANASLIRTDATPGRWSVEASHDGYESRFGLVHRRRIMRGDDNEIVCLDRVIGTAQQAVTGEIRYLVAHDMEVTPVGANGARIGGSDGRPVCTLMFEGSDGHAMPCAFERAFVSPGFAKKLETTSVVLRVPVSTLLAGETRTRIMIGS